MAEIKIQRPDTSIWTWNVEDIDGVLNQLDAYTKMFHNLKRGYTHRCKACKTHPMDFTVSCWRWNGEDWEHACPKNHYQCGHDTLMKKQWEKIHDKIEQEATQTPSSNAEAIHGDSVSSVPEDL
jgi:hypothetical protein